MDLETLFHDFILEAKKDIKKKGSFWNPTLITDSLEGRTVVLRSLQNGKQQIEDFVIHTDTRSKKWKEIENNSRVTLLFYCRKRKWQMRMKAIARMNTLDIESKIEWKRLSPRSQKTYSLKHSPGTLVDSPTEGFTFSDEDGYENFGVLTLEPLSLESLQLSHPTREDLHVRAYWDLETNEKGYLAP